MFCLDRPRAELARAAEGLDGPFVTALAKAASELGVTVVAGMFEAVPGEDRIHNTVVAVGRGGLLGRYRKLHLYDALGRQGVRHLARGPHGRRRAARARARRGRGGRRDLLRPALSRGVPGPGRPRGHRVRRPRRLVRGTAQRRALGDDVPGTGDREHLLPARGGPAASHLQRAQPRARPDGRRARRPRRDSRASPPPRSRPSGWPQSARVLPVLDQRRYEVRPGPDPRRGTSREALAMAGQLAGKVALVTGSASGIGEATARALDAEGASVVVNSVRSVEAGEELAVAADRAPAMSRRTSASEADARRLVATAVEPLRAPRHPRQQRRHDGEDPPSRPGRGHR